MYSLRTSWGVSHRTWKVWGTRGCWKGIRGSGLHTNRACFVHRKLVAKQLIRELNDLRSRCLGNMQHLAQQCTKKVLFSMDQPELGREALADA
jgi:hypothetical protein